MDAIIVDRERRKITLLEMRCPWVENGQQKEEEKTFSNSLIIHKEKAKKITTVTVVWISDTNSHKILRTLSLNFSKNYCSFEKLYPKLHSVFIRYPETSKSFLKNSTAPRISTHFSVSGYRTKHCLSFWIYYLKYAPL